MGLDSLRRAAFASVRTLVRRPRSSAVMVGTLALGIGSSVAVFTLVDGVLLEPLAFPEPERVVSIRHHAPGIALPELESSLGLLDLYSRSARTLQAAALMDTEFRNLAGGDRPDRVRVVYVTEAFFRVTGADRARSASALSSAPDETIACRTILRRATARSMLTVGA